MRYVIPSTAILITGGAGFIGSHLVDAVIEHVERVCVYDNLTSGSLENLSRWVADPRFVLRRNDLRSINATDLKNYGTIFHLAANPDVRASAATPRSQYEQNVAATFALLESIRKADSVKTLVFSSSSTVYGDASVVPTPEDYAPLEPVSVYGASKLACEALIAGYAHTYGFNAIILRFANIVGPRGRHGAIFDFVQKLKADPRRLEILGDGTQKKSYLYLDDLVEAVLLSLEKSSGRVEVLNVGSEDQIDVKSIAEIVIGEMGLSEVNLVLSGGVDGGRGWKGDVKNMCLDIRRLRSLGWRPKHTSTEAVGLAARQLVQTG